MTDHLPTCPAQSGAKCPGCPTTTTSLFIEAAEKAANKPASAAPTPTHPVPAPRLRITALAVLVAFWAVVAALAWCVWSVTGGRG